MYRLANSRKEMMCFRLISCSSSNSEFMYPIQSRESDTKTSTLALSKLSPRELAVVLYSLLSDYKFCFS